MLPIELLRVRINSGKIAPSFCSTSRSGGSNNNNQEDKVEHYYQLANLLIKYFENAQNTNESKGKLREKCQLLESEYGDYKLVRGFFTLLERRCVLKNMMGNLDSILIRRMLFEESSKRGLALSDISRNDIINSVSTSLNLSQTEIKSAMWSDLEENLIVEKFNSLSATDLITWYNISLMQTLLFRCINFDVYIKGGVNWKHFLRKVKMYGLMYNLHQISKNGREQKQQHEEEQDDTNENSLLMCSLDGPMSLFKMTDRYGTSIAKLLPTILASSYWKINAVIVRKTYDGKKLFKFETSRDTSGQFLVPLPSKIFYGFDDSEKEKEPQYDSLLEEKFATDFKMYGESMGWKLTREPDPLIAAEGKAMIPDFLFEKYGKKVYLEIVGFWTREYLERKIGKLISIFDKSTAIGIESENKNTIKNPNTNLLVAINEELSCSEMQSLPKDSVILFKNKLPIMQVINYLKKIDMEIIEEKSNSTSLSLSISVDQDDSNDIISITQIALKYDIPEEAAVRILVKKYPEYKLVGQFLISGQKLDHVKRSLNDVNSFVDACVILETHKIPESCHADLLSKLNYSVVWKDLDPQNAIIKRT